MQEQQCQESLVIMTMRCNHKQIMMTSHDWSCKSNSAKRALTMPDAFEARGLDILLHERRDRPPRSHLSDPTQQLRVRRLSKIPSKIANFHLQIVELV